MIEIIHEPQPTPKSYGGIFGSVKVSLIDAKTGEKIGETSGGVRRNEKELRREAAL